jgi:hypothetical protein
VPARHQLGERLARQAQAAVPGEDGHRHHPRDLVHRHAVHVVHHEQRALPLGQPSERAQHEGAGARRGDLIVGRRPVIHGSITARGIMRWLRRWWSCATLKAIPASHGAQRPPRIEVRPAPPHHEEHVLREVLGVAGAHAVAAKGAVHVVELHLEGAQAARELRLVLGGRHRRASLPQGGAARAAEFR